MMPSTRNLLIGFVLDFILSGGPVILTAMGVKGEFVMPSQPVIIFAMMTGAMAASLRAKSKTEPPVTRLDPPTPAAAPAPAIDTDKLADALLRSLNKDTTPTPQRVPDVLPPPSAAPVKVGGSA